MNKVKKIAEAMDFLVLSPRLGRMRYIAMSFFWTLVFCVPVFLINLSLGDGTIFSPHKFWQLVKFETWRFLPLYIIFLLFGFFLSIRRLNDADFRGWWSLFGIIPIVNFFFGLFLMVYPGTTGSNRFGDSPSPTNLFHRIFGVIAIILTGCFILAYTVGVIWLIGLIGIMSLI